MTENNKNEKTINIVVITHYDLGWDCVVGVYPTIEIAINEICDGDYSNQEELEDVGYIIHDELLTLDFTIYK